MLSRPPSMHSNVPLTAAARGSNRVTATVKRDKADIHTVGRHKQGTGGRGASSLNPLEL